MPVAVARSFWLISCSSRSIRTDSPTETSIPFFALRYSLISLPPVIVGSDLLYLYEHLIPMNLVNDAVLDVES